jgi:dihydropteroate synthase
VEFAVHNGIPRQQIIIDPGIGFGKTLQHNLTLLRRLADFLRLGPALLVGASRKGFIGAILDLEADERLEGSLAVAVAAAMAGANIVRVHDVKETWRALRMADAIRFGPSTE